MCKGHMEDPYQKEDKEMGVLERFSMQGKKVVVTGGAQGIGRAGAEAMAEAGAEVGIFDLNLEIAEKTAKEI